jgi:hypothetical protein
MRRMLVLLLLAAMRADGLYAADEGTSWSASAAGRSAAERIRPGHPEWPVAWMTYRQVGSLEENIRDLKAHEVGLTDCSSKNLAMAWSLLLRACGPRVLLAAYR